jgi:hypothetical protein
MLRSVESAVPSISRLGRRYEMLAGSRTHARTFGDFPQSENSLDLQLCTRGRDVYRQDANQTLVSLVYVPPVGMCNHKEGRQCNRCPVSAGYRYWVCWIYLPDVIVVLPAGVHMK